MFSINTIKRLAGRKTNCKNHKLTILHSIILTITVSKMNQYCLSHQPYNFQYTKKKLNKEKEGNLEFLLFYYVSVLR